MKQYQKPKQCKWRIFIYMIELSVHRLAKGVSPPNLLGLWFLTVRPQNLLGLWFLTVRPPNLLWLWFLIVRPQNLLGLWFLIVCPPNLLWLWFLIVRPPNLLWLWFVGVVVPDCSPPKSLVVVVPDCLPLKSVVVVIVFNFIYHYSPSQADSLHSCCMRFWMSDCSFLQHIFEYSPKWCTYSTILVGTWLVPCLTAAILTCSMYTMHHAKVHTWGTFMFSCHLPDTGLAKWPGSFMYYCNSMGATCTVLLKPAFFLTTYVGCIHV